MLSLLFSLLALSAGSAYAGMRTSPQDCAVFLELLHGKNLDPQTKFDLAQRAKEAFHPYAFETLGTRLRVEGLSEEKQKRVLEVLSDRLENYYRNQYRSPRPGENASPLAAGNESHMRDHLDLLDAFEMDYRKAFGIDPLSLRVITQAHDLGKAVLDEGLHSEFNRRVDEALGNGIANMQPGVDFVRRFVMPHDDHSIVSGLPIVVGQTAQRFNLTDAQASDLLFQLVHHIRGHNFGPLTVDPGFGKEGGRTMLSARYPDLTDKEIETVQNAFWVRFYENGIQTADGQAWVSPFGRDMGIRPQTPRPHSAIGHALALNDRIGLVTDGAMEKIPVQNLSRTGFNAGLIRTTFLEGADAIGPSTVALTKAQYSELARSTDEGSAVPAESFAPVAYGHHVAREATRFGKELAGMNTPEKLASLGISESESNHVMVFQGRKTYKIDGGFFETDAKTGARIWKNHERPTLSVWTEGKWVTTERRPAPTTSGQDKPNGWQLILDLARRDGFRITPPGEFVLRRDRSNTPAQLSGAR